MQDDDLVISLEVQASGYALVHVEPSVGRNFLHAGLVDDDGFHVSDKIGDALADHVVDRGFDLRVVLGEPLFYKAQQRCRVGVPVLRVVIQPCLAVHARPGKRLGLLRVMGHAVERVFVAHGDGTLELGKDTRRLHRIDGRVLRVPHGARAEMLHQHGVVGVGQVVEPRLEFVLLLNELRDLGIARRGNVGRLPYAARDGCGLLGSYLLGRHLLDLVQQSRTLGSRDRDAQLAPATDDLLRLNRALLHPGVTTNGIFRDLDLRAFADLAGIVAVLVISIVGVRVLVGVRLGAGIDKGAAATAAIILPHLVGVGLDFLRLLDATAALDLALVYHGALVQRGVHFLAPLAHHVAATGTDIRLVAKELVDLLVGRLPVGDLVGHHAGVSQIHERSRDAIPVNLADLDVLTLSLLHDGGKACSHGLLVGGRGHGRNLGRRTLLDDVVRSSRVGFRLGVALGVLAPGRSVASRFLLFRSLQFIVDARLHRSHFGLCSLGLGTSLKGTRRKYAAGRHLGLRCRHEPSLLLLGYLDLTDRRRFNLLLHLTLQFSRLRSLSYLLGNRGGGFSHGSLRTGAFRRRYRGSGHPLRSRWRCLYGPGNGLLGLGYSL